MPSIVDVLDCYVLTQASHILYSTLNGSPSEVALSLLTSYENVFMQATLTKRGFDKQTQQALAAAKLDGQQMKEVNTS